LRGAQGFYLTSLAPSAEDAEDTEKTVVFIIPKWKIVVRHIFITEPILVIRCDGDTIYPHLHVMGEALRVPAKTAGQHDMQTGFDLRQFAKIRLRRPCRAVLAALAAVSMLAAPLAPAAFAQNGMTPTQSGAATTTPPSSAPPPAPQSVAPAAPTSAAPDAAPQTPTSNAETPGSTAPSAAATDTTPSAQGANPASETAPAPDGAAPHQPSIGKAELPQDLSPWGMFLNADLVVKAVIIGLALASLVTWTVFVAKTLELRRGRVEIREGLRILANATTLAQAHEQLRSGTTPAAQLMQAAGQEIRLSASARGDGLKERISWQLERIELAISRKIARGTGVLATIGSTAPFVGLFGTVWGIMNSFIGISNAHTTNLAVVAPGIAQALLATALGLIAAIPAVMIYNVLARATAHYRALLGDASAQVMRLVSRDLDRAKQPLSQAAE
jgi:biopolymer transport protein ExbB